MSAPRVAVVGVGAVSAAGFSWRGLWARARAAVDAPAPPPDSSGREVPPIPRELDPSDHRMRKMMSRAAHLAAVATREAVTEARWRDRRDSNQAPSLSPGARDVQASTAFFLGVGASGGAVEDLGAVLRASSVDGRVSLERLGSAGLSATNPLSTFQLLNNFTLCHAAILEGAAGPNAAFFSRGAATVSALEEAAHAIREGDAARALAGGADTALHPITAAELGRDRRISGGLIPAEGAGVLALEAAETWAGSPRGAMAFLEACTIAPLGAPPLDGLRDVHADACVVCAWGPAATTALVDVVRSRWPQVVVGDIAAVTGECLAATPALSWACALDAIASGAAERVVAIGAGVDDRIAAVVFSAR